MITLTLEGQNLAIRTPHIVAGTVDYMTVEIERFGNEWKKLDLHVYFQLGETTYELLTSGDYIGTDAHLNLTEGRWQVSVAGYEYVGGEMIKKITTNAIGLNVAPPPPDAGVSCPEVPMTAFEQCEAIALSVKHAADNGEFDGEKGDTGETGTTFTPSVSTGGDLSWTNDGGKENPETVNIRGPQGVQGNTGATGTTFTPSVSAAGDLSWTNDGGKTNPQTVNIKGPQGETGPAGTTDYNNLTNKPTIPSASSATPQALGTAAAGSSTDYSRADHVHAKPTYSKSDVGLGNVDNVQQYSASNPPPYPVTSVNGSTGDVALTIPSTAADVGALPDTTKYAASLAVGGNATVSNGLPYGVVDGTSTRTVLTVQIPGITQLYDGLCILVKNNVAASNTNCTLNVNGLGAKPIHYSTALNTAITTQWPATATALFYYDSSRDSGNGAWVYYYGYDSNTNTIGYQIRSNSSSLPMTSIVYRYRLLFTSADDAHFVPANNSTSTNATGTRTVCQDKINPFGRIVYYGTTASVAAGSRPSAANLWDRYTVTLGYSFQKSPNYVLTEWKPVYLKCAPQSDGSAIIDSTTPFVQDLPTTEDGKIYIFLGVAYSTTAMELMLEHPVYWYKDGMIRPYTNATQSSGGGSGLPDTPGTDGTYALMNTVASGTGTVSWVKPLVVTIQNYVMSSTYQEISDAFRSGRPVIIFDGTHEGEVEHSFIGYALSVDESDIGEMYRVLFISAGGNISSYTSFSRNGYPEFEY